MADSIWESGVVREVYHPVGRFNDGRRKFRYATFDVLQWASVDGGNFDMYIMPNGPGATADFSSTALNERELGREFGYPDLHPIVIDYHQMGDCSDNIFGLHFFGTV